MRLLVVNYHYIREEKPGKGIYPLTPKEFESQIDAIAEFYKFISIADLREYVEREKFPDQSFCLLTFDDGLMEQLIALDILERCGIPACFFVSSAPIRDGIVLPVHKLHHVRSVASDEEIWALLDEKHDVSRLRFDEAALAAQYRYDTEIARKVKFFLNFTLTADERSIIIDELFHALVPDEESFSRNLYMSAPDLKKLADLDVLGSHGDSHRPLATLDDSHAREDMMASLAFFRQAVPEHTVSAISYPYGGPDAVSSKTAEIADDLGFDLGFTMKRSLNTPEDLRNPLLLHRVDTNDAPGGKHDNGHFRPSIPA